MKNSQLGLHSHRTRTAAVAGLLLATLGLTPGTAFAADPPPSPAPSATANAVPVTRDDKTPLTTDEVERQLSEAARLQSQLTKSNAAYAEASRRLEELSAQSQAAMNAVANARAAETAARAEEAHQLAVLKQLNAQVQAARDDVKNMAYEAYVNGTGMLADVAILFDLITDSAEGSRSAATLDYLAEGRAADEDKYARLAKLQQATAAKAVAARLAREKATRTTMDAQAKVTAALTSQQTALQELQSAREGTADQLRALGFDIQLDTAPMDIRAINALVSGPLCTEDSGNHPNGFFPAGALCPIAGSPGDMMRPGAARALNALTVAYQKDFGQALCITDTYRPHHEQVIVAQRSPNMTAKPGRSKHGLGLAVDLCGGVESFGTVQYLWMKQHAPLFGFFHPAWAEPAGSMPEPWHWEYAN